MRFKYGDIWKTKGVAKVITTNGYIKKDGSLVMGAGIARQAKDKFPGIEYELGKLVKRKGNNVHLVKVNKLYLITFPVKHVWWDDADYDLINQSKWQLIKLVDSTPEISKGPILMPKPGCGNGNLEWKHVRFLIKKHLDDRFIVMDYSVKQKIAMSRKRRKK